MPWCALIISIVCCLDACTGNDVQGGSSTASLNGEASPFATYPLGNGPVQSGNDLGVAIYWGQNEGPRAEPDLATLCTQPQFAQYNTIIISFVTAFVNTRNANNWYPEMDLSDHCMTAYDPNDPYLLKCDDIAAAVPECQQAGKKVLLSLGGALGTYGFPSDASAQSFAQTTWDMFLGGNGNVRPFGKAVLDGIDLDIESGTPTGYAAYANQLRTLMSGDANHTYWITAAPQCPYPDAFLGPGPGLAFTAAQSAFSVVWLQYYNNYCEFTNPQGFANTFKQWSAWSTAGGPRLYIGLPSGLHAADANAYVEPVNALPPLIESAKKNAAFSGIMLWDASFDVNSGAAGQPLYSLSVEQSLRD